MDSTYLAELAALESSVEFDADADTADAAEAVSMVALTRMAKGLSHPARVMILRQLAGGETRIVQDIVGESDLAHSTVSEHLRVLREAGLVLPTRDGPRVWYRLNGTAMRAFVQAVERLANNRAQVRTNDPIANRRFTR